MAFYPGATPELSVVHATGLDHVTIWDLAAKTLGDQPDRTVYARADLPVKELIRNRLQAIRDDDPFERHTTVTGWPSHKNPDEQKALWKQICLEISQCSELRIFEAPTPISLAAPAH
jgi:hypothetical protein